MSDSLFFGTSGPRNARIAVVAESWGWEEAAQHAPLVGQSGQEFTRILADAGINRDDVFLTNVISARPENNEAWRFFEQTKMAMTPPIAGLYPNEQAKSEIARMYAQLDVVRPDVVIAAGNYSLWALTDRASITQAKDRLGKSVGVLAPSGIMNYRGSMLFSDESRTGNSYRVLPIIHPAAILRQWNLRAVTVHDISARVPMALADNWRPANPPTIIAPPDFSEAIDYLDDIIRKLERGPTDVCMDVETIPSASLLVCMGICTDLLSAMSVPFLRVLDSGGIESYWSVQEEAQLIRRFRTIMMHPNARLVGQNFAYDLQWTLRDWGVPPRVDFDTMLAQHLVFPGTPKALHYISSLYVTYHWFWKEDAKEWHMKEESLPELLTYNAMDVLRTLESAWELRALIRDMGMWEQWEWELKKHDLALEMMQRGVRIDRKLRTSMTGQIMAESSRIKSWIDNLFPDELFGSPTSKTAWYMSPAQTKDFFYNWMGLKEITNRKTGNATVGKEAMEELETKYPRLGKLFRNLRALRSLGVFQSHFMLAPLSDDGRMRCSFNTSGTETFRWSSSSNAFGEGTNLQNLPTGNED